MRWIIAIAIWGWAACQLALGYTPTQIGGPLYVNDKVRIAGDSNVQYGENGGGWIDILRQYNQAYHANYNFDIHGRGVLAETSSGLLCRIDSVLCEHPNVLCIMTGINDINSAYAAGQQTNLTLYASNLTCIIRKAKCSGVRQVVLMTPLCWGELPEGWGPYDTRNQLIVTMNSVSQAEGVPVMDCRSLFRDADTIYNPGHQWSGILTWDGVHCSQLGAQILAGSWFIWMGE